ncbi:hypothetical protein AXF42_Ash014544 [Apostasia shenzhenica]|uniref:DUF632 domain-containing protein n=1 Tax=Apostasia shenzhenica TaxID=1088818 RepID=A0A2H9ZWV9_9ASPA|nr:hypothetical protein AXF42_Ash014544 [Apostasia shenzhenica]
MGCGSSKLEELEAVALCRGRSELLAEAIHQRYALADAHAAYAESLRSVGAALHRLLDGGHELNPNGSPVLRLPAQRKGNSLPPPSLSPPPPNSQPPAAIPSAHSRSRSNSGSHIHFHSTEDSDSDGDSPLHLDGDSPVHFNETLGGPTYVNLHYARNQPPPPSVSFEQRAASPEQVQYGSVAGSSSSSSYPYGYPYPTQNPNSFSYPYPYAYQPSYDGYGGMGGFFGSSSPPPAMSQHPSAGAGVNSKASTSRTVLHPPSPPRASTWDFLNPFESFDINYLPYTPSRTSKEFRDDEGIPDLEEDGQEVIKEAYGDQKFGSSSSTAIASEFSGKGVSAAKEDVGGSPLEGLQYQPIPRVDDEDVVEKNVVGGEVQKSQEEQRNVAAPRRYHGVSEIASEIRVQFERAAESTKELARMLEVGKHPYKRKGSVYAVSSRMMCVMPFPMWKDEDLDYEEDKVMSTGNLSSTLQKLYIWEQKLHDEVRVEEKMRILHDRNNKKLQHLDERGAEAHKIEATQMMIRKLSTKIRIAIQFVNSISMKINELRDKELWPQIDELIQGLEGMWKVMLECHQIQCQAVSEAHYLDAVASGARHSDARMNAIMHLELELLRWIGNFSSWINLQKNFVKALNSWLILCLHYEPEETADGIPPYSPGRIGAPPVFVIFNCWYQALERIPEKEVLESMQLFAAKVRQIWHQNGNNVQQNIIVDRETDKLQKMREREAQIISKEVELLNKKLVIASGGDHLASDSLHSALGQVLLALENFSSSCMKAYVDLHARCEEEKAAMEEAKGS